MQWTLPNVEKYTAKCVGVYTADCVELMLMNVGKRIVHNMWSCVLMNVWKFVRRFPLYEHYASIMAVGHRTGLPVVMEMLLIYMRALNLLACDQIIEVQSTSRAKATDYDKYVIT